MSVRNSRSVLFAIFASLLLATTPTAVSADPALDVASQHTTDADFSNAQTLANLTVSGDAVKLQAGSTTIDDFEDGDVSKWSGDIEISQTANSGTYAGLVDGEGAGSLQEGTLDIASISSGGTNVSWAFRTNDFDANSGLRLRDGGTRGPEVGILNTGKFYYYNGSATVTFGSASADTYYTIKLADVDFSADTYDIYVDGVKQVDDAEMANDIGLFDTVAVYAGPGTQSFVDDIEKGEDVTSAKYVSPVHDVTDGEEAAVNIAAATNVSVDITVQTTSGTVVGSTNGITSTGNKTVALSGYSGDELETVVEVDVTGANPLFSLADESILFNASDPTGTLQSPADGAELTESSVDFSIGVSDADFGTAQGDSVEAMLYVDGEVAGSQTVSSNQTVTISDTVSGGGNHTYYWELSDSYGESTTTATRTIKTPTEISLFNETNSSELLDNTTFDVTMYFENGSGPALVEERTVSDGTVNLSGLPATESFIISVQGDGWVNRRILVPSIYESEKIYMLSENEQTVPVVFELEDFTGQFPQPNTTLLVQRGINGTYQTVLGDEFGATGQFPATLATGSRHRFVLLNTNTGQRRVAGTYTPLAGGQQTISVSPDGGIDVLGIEPTVDWIPGTVLIPATDNATIGARLTNRTVDIDSWNVTAVHAPESGSNTTLWTYSATTNGGRQVTTENLSGLSGNLRIDVSYTLTSGISQTQSRLLTLQEQSDAFSYSLLGQLDSAPAGLLPAGDVDATTTAIALMLSVFGMAVVATSTGTTSELTAGTGVLILGGFSIIGWVGYPLVTVAGVAWIGLTAIRRGVI